MKQSSVSIGRPIGRGVPRVAQPIRALGLVAIATCAAAPHAPSTALQPATLEAAVTVALPPAPPPLLVRAVAPDEGRRINAQIPLSSAPNPAARPFSAAAASESDRDRALECMTSAIYYEAGSEDLDGQRAVAQVILNRTRHPAFPASVCGVVYQGSTRPTGCQFTFTCDGSLTRRPSDWGWARARKVAEAALDGAGFAPVGLATHYHANYVLPYWAPGLAKNAMIGAHIFYRWAGSWGGPAAFTRQYRGGEPNAAALKEAALAALATRIAEGKQAPGAAAAAPPAVQLATLEVQIDVASTSLGANHPDMVALRKKRAALSSKAGPSRAAELAAVEAELATAKRTLGARHPRIIALEESRAELGGRRRSAMAGAPAPQVAAAAAAVSQ